MSYNKNIIYIFHNSLILPHMNYCLIIWGYQYNRITKLQKKAIRILYVTKYNSHTEPLLKSLYVLRLKTYLNYRYYDFIISSCTNNYHGHAIEDVSLARVFCHALEDVVRLDPCLWPCRRRCC